jgi:uncharacterized membrane protein SirB2
MALTKRQRHTAFISAIICALCALALAGMVAVEPWVLEGRHWDTMRGAQVLLWGSIGLVAARFAWNLKNPARAEQPASTPDR